MRPPFSGFQFALMLFLAGLLLAFVQIGVLTIAFDKLGLSQSSAFLLLFSSLIGSVINLPLFTVAATPLNMETVPVQWRDLVRKNQRAFKGKTLIAVNVGGGLIPALFSYYLIRYNALGLFDVLLAIAVVAGVSRITSHPIAGLGITMPLFIAPISAALAAIMINPAQSAPLAYIGGTLGVLIGADLLRLGDIRKMGAPIAAIGGAGTFDGIFLSGLVAVLLA
ncbi:MAG TPA: DUF1614 domain-containing protein [Gammaproteobacteria bacterium]|nr:DUF1614 domain-containing protein [Gammaproteobacteria bacterium]